ncbi:sensor histidine kinase [Spirosoma sp.]|uniref:sensor histidine kinase n=1 Tax=Spirosoma sp. TaxID=1899569 RepID=UPI003B3AAB55
MLRQPLVVAKLMPITYSRGVKLRLFGPLALFLFGIIFFRLKIYLSISLKQQLQLTAISIFCGYVGWELGRWAVKTIQRYYPGLARARQRLYILMGVVLVLANFNTLLRIAINHFLQVGVYQIGLIDYLETMGIQIFYVCIYGGIYEGTYLFRQWRQVYEEKEQLIKAEWQARFDSLKSQVNPHFLFNSLNSLSSLIDDEPQKASQFVDELSKVYRYMLQANDRELTTLETELGFIRAYAHLLQTRHGSGIMLEVNIPDQYLTYTIPSLTLQMLAENAVKHNVIAPAKPLSIEIKAVSTADEQNQSVVLVVRNNLQRKNAGVLSNGVGLANISAKYRMLTKSEIIVQDTGGYFTVILPLLPPVSSPQIA